MDFEVVSALFQLTAPLSSFARTMRAMAAAEEFTEGFKEGQVGSTAMPHKMNSRSAERINSLKNILMGYLVTTAGISGDQMYGGDVSDSAARRVALPDSFSRPTECLRLCLLCLMNADFIQLLFKEKWISICLSLPQQGY